VLITVYWEDQRGAQPKAFGPHALLLACPEDETRLGRWALSRMVVAIPKKGDNKLKTALERDAARAGDGGPVVFVFDHDHVRGLFGLAANACKSDVLKAAHGLCRVNVTVVLLEDNVGDLLNACLRATGKPQLVLKPDPNERDTVFQSIAADSRSARDRVRADVASFDRLVQCIQRNLSEP